MPLNIEQNLILFFIILTTNIKDLLLKFTLIKKHKIWKKFCKKFFKFKSTLTPFVDENRGKAGLYMNKPK